VSVTVSDGVMESEVFELAITVTPVNDAPSVDGQLPVQTLERTPVEITTALLLLSDPDNDVADLSVHVMDGAGYQRTGNTITPVPGFVGNLGVNLVASDGELDSGVFVLNVQVAADTVPPVIVLSGSATVTVSLGDAYNDAGASATDNVDGDISDQVVVDNPVDTSQEGTYTVTYSVEDMAGNTAIATRTVIVQATAPPPPPPPVVQSSGGGAVSYLLLVLLAVLAFDQAGTEKMGTARKLVAKIEDAGEISPA
jgi:hypothetical protein